VLPPALEEVTSQWEQIRRAVPGVRWAPIETVHITLHFFGQVSDEELGRGLLALQPVFAAQRPLRLRLDGLGSFPSEERARVLWCGVAGDTGALGQLATLCAETLATAGFPVERRPFQPHCTLGRPRLPWPRAASRRWSELAAQRPSTADFIADVAVLYESLTTGRCGVRHHPRMTLPLCG
jgi:RNA 2',3'-cyclic 3'-phosphodiesterase